MALSASDLERWWLVSVWRVGDVLLQSLYYVCRQHKEEVAGDIFDMLLTFTDFLAFKEMFLAYRTVSSSAIFPFYFFFYFYFLLGGGLPLLLPCFCATSLVLCVQEKEGRGLDLSQGLLITPLIPAGSKQLGPDGSL